MTKRAIILAGGRATRLGPLTAQMNKALVSVGQRPILMHHLELLRDAGITDVTIVVSPTSELQVRDVLDRSLNGLAGNVRVAVQQKALGPVDAVRVGTSDQLVNGHASSTDGILLLMADTFIDEPLFDWEMLPPGDEDWIGISPCPDPDRSWCFAVPKNIGTRMTIRWQDGAVAPGAADVAIGVYHFTSLGTLHLAATDSLTECGDDGECPMSPMLNKYTEQRYLWPKQFPTWQDIGDIKALARMKRDRYITRSFNKLHFEDPGVVVKTGTGPEFEREHVFMQQVERNAHPLFPRILWTTYPGCDTPSYGMEYVDLPTLAELYLYWPGRPDMWAAILEGILQTLNEHLWRRPVGDYNDYVEKMYIVKTANRLAEVKELQELGDNEVIDKLLLEVMPQHIPLLATGHGDLNFGNILYSLSSMTFKLIDPRGDQCVDMFYEFAKLRYSYADGFNAICHGLFEIVNNEVILGPRRDAEIAAMDEVLSRYDLPAVKAIEACIFLSAAALHEGEQARAMYLQGMKLAREVTHE